MMHEPILHSSMLASGQVCEVAARRDYDSGTIKKAFAKRDRRKTKRPSAGGKTMNKSCDTCSIKKRRCDGGRPCSRCVNRGDGHKCTYSTRRPYTPRNRPARLWGSSTSSPGQTSDEVASATSGSSCRKCSMGSDFRDVKDQQNTRERPPPGRRFLKLQHEFETYRSIGFKGEGNSSSASLSSPLPNTSLQHQPLEPPAVSSTGHKENISAKSSVVEASPLPDGPTEMLNSKCSSVAINEVYSEHALAQQGVMSLIVSTNSLPLHISNNGPYQQTSMKQDHVPCCELDEACDIGIGYAEMMLRTVSLEGQNNQKSGDIPGLAVDCPLPAYSATLVRDVSIETDDDIGSTLDLDVNTLPSSWSDDGASSVVHHVPDICFEQHLPQTSENIPDITTADEKLPVTKVKSFSALDLGEREVISAEDWFQFAATL